MIWVIYTRTNALCGNLAINFFDIESANEWIDNMADIEVVDICKSL